MGTYIFIFKRNLFDVLPPEVAILNTRNTQFEIKL